MTARWLACKDSCACCRLQTTSKLAAFRAPIITHCCSLVSAPQIGGWLQAHSFELELDTSALKQYKSGGIVTQFKEPKDLK